MTDKPTRIRITWSPDEPGALAEGEVFAVESWLNRYPVLIVGNGRYTAFEEKWEDADKPPAQLRAEPLDPGSHPFPAGTATAYPDGNPKTAAGCAKPGVQHVPPVALFAMGAVMDGGARKYGPFNWRDQPVTWSTYYNAALRHLMAYHEGQDMDPESGLSHLAHVMSGLAIVLDAAACGKLQDDRTGTAGPLPSYLKDNAK